MPAKKAVAKPKDTTEVVHWDPDEWTFEDLETFEEVTGLTLDEALRPGSFRDGNGHLVKDSKGRPVKSLRLSAKTLMAITLIEKRKLDPDYTLAQAKKEKFESLSLESEKPDPKDSEPESNDTED